MKKLWAPWRIGYVQKQSKGCIFCRAAKAKQDNKYYVVHRSKFCFSILNTFPYNNGHIMIAPYRHTGDINELNNEQLLDLIKVLKIAQGQLDKTLKPQAYNIGINIGKEAGAGFANHLHIHIVPRWKGDVNFMPVIYDTKIVSQSLKQLYNKLTSRKK
ncbi:MAG: HIT domain-containing protein [Candidatus Omnitrophica bacterium]|nr:HIT domain-containing protein [Candidatus Omnitrophota bacterium]